MTFLRRRGTHAGVRFRLLVVVVVGGVDVEVAVLAVANQSHSKLETGNARLTVVPVQRCGETDSCIIIKKKIRTYFVFR